MCKRKVYSKVEAHVGGSEVCVKVYSPNFIPIFEGALCRFPLRFQDK